MMNIIQEEPKNKQGDSTQNAGEANNADGSNIKMLLVIYWIQPVAINQADAASEALAKLT